MRKLIFLLLSFLFISSSYGYQCDQNFYGKLRYGYQYKFYDNFSNTSNKSIGINKVDVNYTEQYDYNGSTEFPNFNWTSWFIGKGYILNPGDSGKVIEADSNYPIEYHPLFRSKDNFIIQYKAKYFEKNGGKWDMSDPKYHTECKHYEITWCGDGVVDPGYGEQCDPNDTSHKGWGSGGCSLACKAITKPTTPSCDGLGVNPTNGKAPLSSSLYCIGTNVDNYKIEIKKAGNLIKTINSNNGNYIFSNTGSYIATCYVNGNTTSQACTKTITVNDGTSTGAVCGNGIVEPPEQCDDGNTVNGDGCSSTCKTEGGGGGGGGGIAAMCYDIKTSGNQVTCIGNREVKSFKIDCGNGTSKFVSAIQTNNQNRETNGSAVCDYSTVPKVSEPKCYVSGLSLVLIPNPKENYGGWGTRNQCQATVGQTCGNGILEGNEECEKDSNGNWPSICNTNCTLKNPGGVSTTPGTVPGVITIPNSGNIIFGERANVIIYRGQSVADKVSTPYIYNDSDYDLHFKAICVTQTSGNTITRPVIQPNCKALPGILYPGEKIYFPGAYNEYKGKRIISGNYGDNVLKITYQKHDGEILDWAYFAETVKVRVAKPSIITTGGGTSYIRNTNKISDINKVANGVVATNKVDSNKNFVGTSVSNLTSYSKKTTDSQVVNNTKKTGDNYNNSFTGVTNDTTPATTKTKTSLSDFSSYNGMKNVYILKSKNFKVNSDLFSGINGPRTYIIENGDLYINKDIIYNDNIAFVVKGGNIIIKSSVDRLDGTYITLKKGFNGGKIISEQSTNILTVNGSLYGNIDNLVDNRIKVNENNGELTVGTIVSFGSSLFRKPAPLVGQFITEYLDQAKVAK